VTEDVKGTAGKRGSGASGRRGRALRSDLVAQTEDRILAAATELFERDGYAATTLTAIAERAGVGDRTVYVRFGTKVALFNRVVVMAIAGGPGAPGSTAGDQQPGLTEPTVEERIAAYAHYSRMILERTGRLFAVAHLAAGLEPEIEVYWARGRRGNRREIERLWATMGSDGLLPAGLDLDWLVSTAVILGAADTYLTMTRMYDWGLDDYERWLAASYTRLVPAAGSSLS
jgi:AcrR family transcriptional regulator